MKPCENAAKVVSVKMLDDYNFIGFLGIKRGADLGEI